MLTEPGGQQLGRLTYRNIEQIICFTPGTRIATPMGEVAVENLRVGDKVFTRDNGIQEMRWIGQRDLSPQEMALTQQFQPVVVRAGSLGQGMPERDLVLSPNHRLLLTGDQASLYFGETEVLCAAKHLTTMEGIDRIETRSIRYVHMMSDRHEVVLSNGAWTETFQPGDFSLKGVKDEQRAEIISLFPELEAIGATGGWPAARKVIKRHEAQLIRS